MSAQSQTQNYISIIEDRVYSKGPFFICSSKKGNPHGWCNAVILPRRFTEPTDNEIIGYLQNKSKESQEHKELIPPDNLSPTSRTQLEELLSDLPPQILKYILENHRGCINFLRDNTRITPLMEGEQKRAFLNIIYGLIPNSHLTNEIDTELRNYEWYNKAFSDDNLREDGFGYRWQMNLLIKNGKLPNKDEVFVLIKHQTHESRTLYLSRCQYPVEEVTDVVNAVYDNIFRDENFERFYDVSDQILEKESLFPALALHQKIQRDIEEAKRMEQLAKELDNGNNHRSFN